MTTSVDLDRLVDGSRSQEVLDFMAGIMRDSGERTSERMEAAITLGMYYGLWDGRGWAEPKGVDNYA